MQRARPQIYLPVLLGLILGGCWGRIAEQRQGGAGAGRARLLRAPYLQMALGDSATVMWRTDTGSTAGVRFRPAGSQNWRSATGEVERKRTGAFANEVVLNGLAHSESYEYEVITDGRVFAGRTYTFVSPAPADDTAFSFFAVGDIGEPVALEGAPQFLARALERDTLHYAFGLLLGDIVYPEGRSEDYDEVFFRHFADYFPTTAVYPVLGNHDWHEPEQNYTQEWRLPGNEHYYSFDYGNVRFIALDSGPEGEIWDYERQVAWLEERLGSTAGRRDWTVVYLHHNGKSCTYKQDYGGVVSLYPLFEKYGVDFVFNGHAHTYERLNPMDGKGDPIPAYVGKPQVYTDPRGFISTTIGSGGKLRGMKGDPTAYAPDAERCRHPDLVARDAHTWAYLGLTVNGRELRGTAYDTRTHAVIDSFVVRKSAAFVP